MSLKLVVVTAMVDPEATFHFWESWRKNAGASFAAVVVHQGEAWNVNPRALLEDGDGAYLHDPKPTGPIPAFARGVAVAHAMGADIIACLHDDLRIDEPRWAAKVIEFFAKAPAPRAVLAGFGGAKRLGNPAWDYTRPPEELTGDELVQALARHDFRSNMEQAEAHGSRTREIQPVACLDGFSLIGRADFMAQAFAMLNREKLVHHAYDSFLGVLASQMRRAFDIAPDHSPTWLLPFACHHHGGITAVANPSYHDALKEQGTTDSDEWLRSHRWLYQQLRARTGPITTD